MATTNASTHVKVFEAHIARKARSARSPADLLLVLNEIEREKTKFAGDRGTLSALDALKRHVDAKLAELQADEAAITRGKPSAVRSPR